MAQYSFPRIWMRALLAPILILLSLPALGSTITVSNTADDGSGSLRRAIADAASGDTINFSVTGVINLVTPLTIDSSGPRTLTITGPGAFVLSIRGGDAVPVFIIQPLAGLGGPVTLTISN